MMTKEEFHNSPPTKSADQVHEEYVQSVTKQIVSKDREETMDELSAFSQAQAAWEETKELRARVAELEGARDEVAMRANVLLSILDEADKREVHPGAIIVARRDLNTAVMEALNEAKEGGGE